MGVFTYWPNRITAIRFVGAMVLFVLFAVGLDRTVAEIEQLHGRVNFSFWLFVIIAATDFLDGYLARRDGHITAFGRIADPFTDKVLILGTMIFLAAMPWSRPWLPAWMVVLILAREFLVTGIRGYVESQGGEFPADRLGKIKMVVQCMAVGGMLWIYAWPWPPAWFEFWSGVTHTLVWATLLTTVGSGASYVLKTGKVLAEIEAP
jgi:CDP-diacylglycerol--glycerol-3-phosphate 3-phosphatidyltransferase